MKRKRTQPNRIISRIKNHPMVAFIIFIGTIFIGLSTFTDAVKNLLNLITTNNKPVNLDTVPWNSLQSEYIEAFDIPYKDREDVWFVDEDNTWSTSIIDGQYCLTNTKGEEDIRYNYVGITQKDVSVLPVSVEIKIINFNERMPFSSGGLIYCFDHRSKYYYAFTISINGNFYFYKRNATGFNVIYSGRSDMIRKDFPNKLAIVRANDLFHLYINNSLVKSIKDQELKSGDTGVIGISIGKYCFDNFTIYKKTRE